MKFPKSLISPILVILLTIFAMFPLFHPGFFTMHDDEQIARLYDLNSTLLAGEIPPRIAPNLGFGYGYPFFNFYPSFAYYVGEFFHLFGFGFIDSTKLMIASGFILSALFMYIFSKEFFGKLGGLVSAVSYTYASYHAIDTYVRGAFAEFYAFVFIPLIFWSAYKAAKEDKWRYVILGALSSAGLILAHNLVAFMSFPFIAVWLVYLLLTNKNKKMLTLKITSLFLMGFGLSSYFFIPSYVEKGHTLVNILTSELANYSLHFVCVHQLWDSPWGYGGSIPGCYDGISFEIGKIQILLSIISVLLAALFIKHKKYRQKTILILVFSCLFLGGAFLTVKFSKPIWEIIQPLWYVQFPWRFLLIIAFVSSFLSGSILYFVKNNVYKVFVAGVCVILLILSTASHFSPERFFNASDTDYTNTEKIRWYTSSLSYEYVPKGIATKKSKEGTTLVDITKNEIAKSAFTVLSGSMDVAVLKDIPQTKEFRIHVNSSGVFRINTYSFPGWEVFVNGKKVVYADNNKLKLIDKYLNTGNYVVEARFSNTGIRASGNVITILSIIVLLVSTVYFKFKKLL